MTCTDALIDFATTSPHPTDRATAMVRFSAQDWAACGRAGRQDTAFRDWANGVAGTPTVPLHPSCDSFTGPCDTPTQAALINGSLSHALDFDDTHFAHIGHPSVVIFPAVMAAGPQNWQQLENAALIGIEASIHVGLAFGRDHYQAGFHQTATAGAFGACLAAAHVMGLSPVQTRMALGLCATQASGLKATFGTMGKPLNAGLAARTGYESARWAQLGMTGPQDGIDAFVSAHGLTPDATAGQGLGDQWQIEALSHKFHACCHGLHATLEALRNRPEGVVHRVKVKTHPRWMTVCNITAPQTGLEAKFSYRQVVAMVLNGRDTGDAAAFSDAAAQDRAIIATRDRITVTADPTLSETESRLHLTMETGDCELHHDLAHPMDLSELGARIRQKSSHLIGANRTGAIETAISSGDLKGFQSQIFDPAMDQ